MADAFDSAWGVIKGRIPSNIMMRRLDPDKLQERAQRHHDSILQQVEDGTYEHETMVHPLWPHGFDKAEYEKYIKEGGLTGAGHMGGEWFEDGIPHRNLPVPEKHDEGYSVPRVSFGDQYASQYPNGEWHLVNTEGVGGRLFEGQPQRLDVHLSHHNNEGKRKSSSMLPMKPLEIGIEDIAGLLGTEEKPLEEVVRVHNHRLDMNYHDHKEAMWEGGLGEQPARDPIEDAQDDRDNTPGTLDGYKFASTDVFDDAWGVAKSGDFFFGGRPGTKDRMVPKGVNRAVKSGHKWANTPHLRGAAKQAATQTARDTGGGSEHSTFIRPPPQLWNSTEPWSGNENPKHRPWRAINLSEYGRRMPKNRRTGLPEMRSDRQELDVIEDMFDRDTHEASHEALELPLRGMPPSVHEYGAIAAQTSGHPRARGIRGLLGLPARDTRRKRFRSALGTHPVMQRRRRR